MFELCVQVIPCGDQIQHENGDDCPCGPEVKFVEEGGAYVVHWSLDGRESKEVMKKSRSFLLRMAERAVRKRNG